MNTSDITNYIQKMEQLIQMQQIELDKTRNLLGRALDEDLGEIVVMDVEYAVPDNVSFDARRGASRHAVTICKQVLPTPMKSMYECITELKKELNL